MNRFLRLIATSVLVLAATTAEALPITFQGGSSGTLSTGAGFVEFNSQTNTLTFTLTNTSNITSPGSTSTITGIGFDLAPIGNASASGLNGFVGSQAPSLSSSFTFSDADLGNVPGLNNVVLDFGFVTGASGNFSGGSPNDGLAPAESGSFTVSGAAFSGFTESQLAAALFVRFQNVPAPFGSDVATTTAVTAVPEPAIGFLSGAGLIALARRFVKRRRAAAHAERVA